MPGAELLPPHILQASARQTIVMCTSSAQHEQDDSVLAGFFACVNKSDAATDDFDLRVFHDIQQVCEGRTAGNMHI